MKKAPQKIALNLIDTILEASNQEKKIQVLKLSATLRTITDTFPYILWDDQNIWKLGKTFLILYHYDMYEDEDTNITLIHEAYISAQRSVDIFEKQVTSDENAHNNYFLALHTQLLILQTCTDCFIPVLSNLYAKKSGSMTEQEIHVAQQLSYAIIPLMQYAILEKISEHFKGFKNDPFLEDICTTIEIEHPDITAKQIAYATQIHAKMLYDIQQDFLKNHPLTN